MTGPKTGGRSLFVSKISRMQVGDAIQALLSLQQEDKPLPSVPTAKNVTHWLTSRAFGERLFLSVFRPTRKDSLPGYFTPLFRSEFRCAHLTSLRASKLAQCHSVRILFLCHNQPNLTFDALKDQVARIPLTCT